MKAKIETIGIVSLFVVSGFLGIMSLTSENASAYTTHNPIYINGNADFTAANGVSDGTGTQTDPYIIEGWEISALSAHGIEIRNTDAYFIVRNCYVHDGKHQQNDGIYFNNVRNGRIENLNSSDNWYGIRLESSSSNNISKNSANSNSNDGITLYSSSYNNIFDNIASNNNDGIALFGSIYNNIYNNIANSNHFAGIAIYYYSTPSSYNNIFNNSASHNNNGIFIKYSSDNNIFNNSASNNLDGIYIKHSSYNNIFNNIANSNYYNGICVYYHSRYNNIFNNSVSNNDDGIYLWWDSSDNKFVFNNISYNNRAVEVDSDCENNVFHHNNFISGNAVNVIDDVANTKWDDSYGEGNYWSNYIGLDDGSSGRVVGDGVGDTNIPHMGLDNCPLMEPAGRRNMPPVISSVLSVSDITANSATISWVTDENSDSRVNYSINADLSSNLTEYDSTMTTSHSITLAGLNQSTTYYFEIISADEYGNTVTDDNNTHYYTFTPKKPATAGLGFIISDYWWVILPVIIIIIIVAIITISRRKKGKKKKPISQKRD